MISNTRLKHEQKTIVIFDAVRVASVLKYFLFRRKRVIRVSCTQRDNILCYNKEESIIPLTCYSKCILVVLPSRL